MSNMTPERRYELEYERINEAILDLQDSVDRFKTLNTVYYDKKQHLVVITEYNDLLNKIKESIVTEEDKRLFVEIIKNLFEGLLSNYLQ